MLGKELAELISFFREDKAVAFSSDSAIESEFHIVTSFKQVLDFIRNLNAIIREYIDFLN